MGTQKPHVLLLVPLLIAVVLVTLAVPVICAMPVAEAAGCGMPAVAHTSMPMHTQIPVPQPAGGHTCQHRVSATTAVSPDNVRFASGLLALVAIVVLVATSLPQPLGLAARVVLEPSPPPGLVLTAAHLRV